MFRNRKYKTPRNNAGQSTVEYILIVTAVVATIIAMTGSFKAKMNNTLDQATNGITDRADMLDQTHSQIINLANQNAQISVSVTDTTSPFSK